MSTGCRTAPNPSPKPKPNPKLKLDPESILTLTLPLPQPWLQNRAPIMELSKVHAFTGVQVLLEPISHPDPHWP